MVENGTHRASLSSGLPWNLQCTIESMGPDFVCHLGGGDEHVGAAALSFWDGDRPQTKTVVAGGHKEGPLAEHSAHKLCLATHRTVTVVSGIHYDGLSVDQVKEVTASAYKLVKLTAQRLHEERLRDSIGASGSVHSQILSRIPELATEVESFLATPIDVLLRENEGKVAEIQRRHFEQKVVLFAPLYLSSACLNECDYCGFRRSLRFKRTRLSMEEAVAEAEYLAREGHRSLDIVTGETPSRPFIKYLCEVIHEIRHVTDIEKINLNLGALSAEDYARLKAAGATGYHLYQETYDPETYFGVHSEGPKRDMEYRLEGARRAAQAGFRFLGLGILLGLNDPTFELAALICHAEALLSEEPECQVGFSLPRIQAVGGQSRSGAPHPVSDEMFVKAMLLLRLRFPQAHLTLTTRETPALRDFLIPLGITKLSAGVSTAPGGYTIAPEDGVPQFSIHDERPFGDVADLLRRLGLRPVSS